MEKKRGGRREKSVDGGWRKDEECTERERRREMGVNHECVVGHQLEN